MIEAEAATPSASTVLLTGATGYVGGRLRVALEEAGVPLRCLARRPEFLEPRVGPHTEVVAGDLLAPETLPAALEGVHTAYYLVHSMGGGGDFEKRDRRAAKSFAQACAEAGVARIVYLGGLGRTAEGLSAHLRSRQEVGAILGRSGVPTVELRASIVIGSGSLSFEMVRSLVERLPVMLTPRWVRQQAQPIAVEDLIAYLREAREVPCEGHLIVEIGGRDRVDYRGIMLEYARQRGLRRWLIPVPLLTPGLSRLWLGLVTPLYARVGRELIESIRHPTVVEDPRGAALFSVAPMGIAEAVGRALAQEDQDLAQTRWNDASSATVRTPVAQHRRLGHRLLDERRVEVDAPPAQAFAPIRRLGGQRGWYFGNLLWQLRGMIDVLVGGPGLRRGRRDPEHLLPGDALDFWRVERYEPDRALRLRAEMRLPGRAWLQYDAVPTGDGQRTVVNQTATFDPAGLGGRLYWYGIYPIHRVMFAGLLRRIARLGRQSPDHEVAPPQSLGAVVLWVALCLAVGALGGLFTAESVSDWYVTLRKPDWTPPGWLFGPVWTLLYVMMGVAAARVWVWRRRRPVGVALSLFGVQLGLNLLWSVLFFGLREPGWALVEIGALLVAIGATGIAFWRVERVAALLLLPYLGWVGFASALNLALWRMNG